VANPLVSPETLSASLEVLSAFSEALCYCFPVVSASSEVLPAITLFSNTSNSGLLRPWHRARTISADFRFNFLKIRSIIFRKPKPETPLSTVLLGRSASCRLHQHARLPTTRRRVAFTRSRVDLTCGCVAHTRRRLDRYLRRVLYSSDPQQCRRSFLRVGDVVRRPSPARVVHAPVVGFRSAPFLRLFYRCCCCLLFLLAYLFSLLCLCCFVFVGVLCQSFRNFLLILLISVATVVLSWFSFPVVVVSLTNSKTFQSLHAEITYRSYLATYSEGCADDESEDCSFIFLFLFIIRLCSALYCVHVVRWVASSLDFEEAFPTFM
jgi:hypothetical protein